MNIERLKQVLIRHEGVEYKVYLDTEGLKTAGIGHLLIGADSDLPVNTPVTKDQVNNWFAKDVQRSILLAQQIIPNFSTLDEVRQELCVDLTFNLGNRLKQFRKFLKAIENKDFNEAANELKDSKWYSQVKTRGDEVCESFRVGEYTFKITLP